jgi:DSF synthase
MVPYQMAAGGNEAATTTGGGVRKMSGSVRVVPRWGSFLDSADNSTATITTELLENATLDPLERLRRLSEIDVSVDRDAETFWCMMRPERPCFRPALLEDLAEMQRSIRRIFIGRSIDAPPIRYFVVGSHTPGIFNLGGDLSLFAQLIRRGDREKLRHYARACIDVVYNNSVGYELPIVTVAMVQGNALGGGFEAALSCDVIVAEHQARFGLPEIIFNLFPGMGAYSFLSRKIGPHHAERIISSGRIYEAKELHELGVVDVLVEDGRGPDEVRSYIARHRRRHNAEQALFQVRRLVNPVSYDELCNVTDLWVESALKLREPDLRKMERISTAQGRRLAADQRLAV